MAATPPSKWQTRQPMAPASGSGSAVSAHHSRQGGVRRGRSLRLHNSGTPSPKAQQAEANKAPVLLSPAGSTRTWELSLPSTPREASVLAPTPKGESSFPEGGLTLRSMGITVGGPPKPGSASKEQQQDAASTASAASLSSTTAWHRRRHGYPACRLRYMRLLVPTSRPEHPTRWLPLHVVAKWYHTCLGMRVHSCGVHGGRRFVTLFHPQRDGNQVALRLEQELPPNYETVAPPLAQTSSSAAGSQSQSQEGGEAQPPPLVGVDEPGADTMVIEDPLLHDRSCHLVMYVHNLAATIDSIAVFDVARGATVGGFEDDTDVPPPTVGDLNSATGFASFAAGPSVQRRPRGSLIVPPHSQYGVVAAEAQDPSGFRIRLIQYDQTLVQGRAMSPRASLGSEHDRDGRGAASGSGAQHGGNVSPRSSGGGASTSAVGLFGRMVDDHRRNVSWVARMGYLVSQTGASSRIEQWLESLFCSSNAAAMDRVVLRRLAKRNRASAPGWGGGGAAEWAAFRWTTLPGVRVVDREAMTQALQTMVWAWRSSYGDYVTNKIGAPLGAGTGRGGDSPLMDIGDVSRRVKAAARAAAGTVSPTHSTSRGGGGGFPTSPKRGPSSSRTGHRGSVSTKGGTRVGSAAAGAEGATADSGAKARLRRFQGIGIVVENLESCMALLSHKHDVHFQGGVVQHAVLGHFAVCQGPDGLAVEVVDGRIVPSMQPLPVLRAAVYGTKEGQATDASVAGSDVESVTAAATTTTMMSPRASMGRAAAARAAAVRLHAQLKARQRQQRNQHMSPQAAGGAGAGAGAGAEATPPRVNPEVLPRPAEVDFASRLLGSEAGTSILASMADVVSRARKPRATHEADKDGFGHWEMVNERWSSEPSLGLQLVEALRSQRLSSGGLAHEGATYPGGATAAASQAQELIANTARTRQRQTRHRYIRSPMKVYRPGA